MDKEERKERKREIEKEREREREKKEKEGRKRHQMPKVWTLVSATFSCDLTKLPYSYESPFSHCKTASVHLIKLG